MKTVRRCLIGLFAGILIMLLVSCSPAAAPSAEVTQAAANPVETAQAEAAAEKASAPVPTKEAPLEPAAPTEETPAEPQLMPADPPEPEHTLVDADSSLRYYEKRTISGDTFLDNLYERPFTSREMIYQPDLDITFVDFAVDDDFFYFTVNLFGLDADSALLTGVYGVEFDRTKTGRGDLLVQVQAPKAKWSMENLTVYTDANGDVGGRNPILADEGFKGNGYDTQVVLEGDKVAFARIAPDDAEAVQFAVSKTLLDAETGFLWGAWADGGLKDITKFDYNDTMGPTAAGSPLKNNEEYPIKDLFSLDNTCRLPYGITQSGAIYFGMCVGFPKEGNPKGKNCQLVCPAAGGLCTQICN